MATTCHLRWASPSLLSPSKSVPLKRFSSTHPQHLKSSRRTWLPRRPVACVAALSAAGAGLRDQAAENAEAKLTAGQSDPWLEKLVSKVVEPAGNGTSRLGGLHAESKRSLEGARLPISRDEAWRFTDLKGLKAAEVVPVDRPSSADIDISDCTLEEAQTSRVVIVDGVISSSYSNLTGLPDNVTVSAISDLPSDTNLSKLTSSGDVFAKLNGLATLDALVIDVPEGAIIEQPIHIIYYSTAGDKTTLRMSTPRCLVTVGAGGEVELLEEFVGGTGGYFTNSVTELYLEKGAKAVHGYLEHQAREAFHIKRTFVQQAEASEYSMVEAGWGGKLTRHNFQVEQTGPETSTEIGTYYLCGRQQLHDLHSSIVLDHPRGKSNQLHKCIVADSSGHGVFDGNVRVNRLAQQTDAQQLSRNLLLCPRATVNVKPNLQIVADDVKCTHGAAISDLEDEQLFYFRARGIDEETARSALVYSFGCEVIDKLRHEGLRQRIEEGVKEALAAEGAVNISAV